jgi:hypothetical protein
VGGSSGRTMEQKHLTARDSYFKPERMRIVVLCLDRYAYPRLRRREMEALKRVEIGGTGLSGLVC